MPDASKSLSPAPAAPPAVPEASETRKHAFWAVIRELLLFVVVLLLVLGPAVGLFFVLNGFTLEGYTYWFHLLWYPLVALGALVFFGLVRRRPAREVLLGSPAWPRKGTRWFYVAYAASWVGVVVTWAVLLATGLARVPGTAPVVLAGFFHACVGAPLVEEVLFRGYLYGQAETIYGSDGWLLTWTARARDPATGQPTTKTLMTFQVAYAALFSSFWFGVWHMNVFKAIYTFFGGLFFCKTRREWAKDPTRGSLVAPVILHASWNCMAQLVAVTEFLFLADLIDALLAALAIATPLVTPLVTSFVSA